MEQGKWPRLAYNWTSVTGSFIALASLFAIVFLFLINLISPPTSAYRGIFLYLVIPAFLVFGLLLIPLGMYLKWRSVARGGKLHPYKWPVVDFNNPRYRNATALFLFGTLGFLLLSSVGIYKAYQYTDSVQFCGQLCHRVMSPEFTAYRNSPHAGVKCVDCHIGPGAGWYAKSKISGLYQVYATLSNIYPRPLPTPIKDLRPVQQECYQCHWPNKIFGLQQRAFPHYLYDKESSPWPIYMLVKTGGGTAENRASGIHWHMNISVKVEYAARDRKLQDIPWVRITDKATGKTDIYQDTSKPFTAEELSTAKVRVMDCVDCHNRPSHLLHPPDYLADQLILNDRVDRGLPEIKKAVVQALQADYKSTPAAMAGIRESVEGFYRKNYPEICAGKKEAIEKASAAAGDAYKGNFFPEMRAKWSDYPDNIGHFYFRGCMRCHDGEHKDSRGKTITNDCRACHIIYMQGPVSGKSSVMDIMSGMDFRHPVDIGGAWKSGMCSDCHTGIMP